MSSGGGETTVTNQPSPEQSQAFQFRMNQAQSALNNLPGEAGYFTHPSTNPFNLSESQQQAISGVQQAANNLPPDPTNNWAMNAYGPAAGQLYGAASAPIGVPQNPALDQWNTGAKDLSKLLLDDMGATRNQWLDFAQAGGAMAASPINVGGIDMGSANVDFNATGATYNPVGVGTQAPVNVARIDPQGAIEAAQHQLSTISSPAIRNALQASGMGRSGAEAEALAQEGVRLELPIQQQILQAEAQANELEAQIKARQQEVELLAEQAAKLQAQSLTATSREMAQQINGQLAGIEAQIRGRLAEAQFMGQVQASIAQRTSALQYASSSLGQLAGLTMGQQQLGAQTGLGLLGQLSGMGLAEQQLGMQGNIAQRQGQLGVGQGITSNLAQMGVAIPGLQSQQYQNALTGAQTNLQASSLQQQMAQQQWLNQQNYLLSLTGAAPLPNQIPGGTQQTQGPGTNGMQALGTAALAGSMFLP